MLYKKTTYAVVIPRATLAFFTANEGKLFILFFFFLQEAVSQIVFNLKSLKSVNSLFDGWGNKTTNFSANSYWKYKLVELGDGWLGGRKNMVLTPTQIVAT